MQNVHSWMMSLFTCKITAVGMIAHILADFYLYKVCVIIEPVFNKRNEKLINRRLLYPRYLIRNILKIKTLFELFDYKTMWPLD